MIQIGVQQLMLSSLTGSDEALLETLKRIKEYGFDSIELNSFMVHPHFLSEPLPRLQAWEWGRQERETGRTWFLSLG